MPRPPRPGLNVCTYHLPGDLICISFNFVSGGGINLQRQDLVTVGSHGLVGYDTSLTPRRSPVRSWVWTLPFLFVLFCFFCLFCLFLRVCSSSSISFVCLLSLLLFFGGPRVAKSCLTTSRGENLNTTHEKPRHNKLKTSTRPAAVPKSRKEKNKPNQNKTKNPTKRA